MIARHSVLFSLCFCSLALAADDEKLKLDGTWHVTSATDKGTAIPDKLAKHLQVTITGDKVKVSLDETSFLEGIFTTDTERSPHHLDLIGGEDKSKQLGIFELNKDSVRICLAAAGSPRPEKFESTAENKAYLLVGQRQATATWLADWIYDPADRKLPINATVPDLKIFQRRMTTKDDVDKVCEFYQAALDKNGLKYSYGDKDGHFEVDMNGCNVFFGAAGGTSVQTVNMANVLAMAKLLKKDVKELNIDPDMHLYTTTGADSTLPGKDEPRSVVVRIATQDTKDYTVTIVVTRAKDEDHTHILATFVVR
jgi:uncharacterized protein (TIGR03067 family)